MNGTIKNAGHILIGRITPQATLAGRMSSCGTLVGSLYLPEGYEDYEGSYVITPDVDQQVISTNDRHLTEDIIIQPIPYAEVSNDANGYTVTIG